MNFAPNRGFRGQAIYWCYWNLYLTDPCCHGNEKLKILTQNWLKLS